MADINALTRENELNKYRNTQLYKDLMAGVVTPEMVQSQMGSNVSTGTAIGRGLGQLPDLFLQMGGLKPRTQDKPQYDMNDFVTKEKIKQSLKAQTPVDTTKDLNTIANKAAGMGVDLSGVTDINEARAKLAQAVAEKEASKTINIASPEGIPSEKQVQGRALARKLYGVRGMDKGLPEIYQLMREGKTLDDIEDSLRFAGQSKEMTGTLRNAAQNIAMGASPGSQEIIMDMLDDAVSSGDSGIIKETYKRAVLSQVPIDQKNQIVGSERTLEFLQEIKNDLQILEDSGVNTNIFAGTAEDISKKIGTVNNPELRRIATKISAAIQKYRRSMSGVAFSVPESAEYSQMFPGIGKTGAFNKATIKGLEETLTGDLENIYGLYMGKKAYKELYKNDNNVAEEQNNDDAMINALLDQMGV